LCSGIQTYGTDNLTTIPKRFTGFEPPPRPPTPHPSCFYLFFLHDQFSFLFLAFIFLSCLGLFSLLIFAAVDYFLSFQFLDRNISPQLQKKVGINSLNIQNSNGKNRTMLFQHQEISIILLIF